MNTNFDNGRFLLNLGTQPTQQQVERGLQRIRLESNKNALLYIPAAYEVNTPAAFAIMLHGAGGNAHQGMSFLKPYADAANIILLAPYSKGASWDIISYDRFGPDVSAIQEAMSKVLEYYAVDAKRIAIGGFSDGASYALSLGLINGDVFTHVIAYSPGFFYTPEMNGKPKVFISHGIDDKVLPIDACSRRIVSNLKKLYYDLEYREFEGPHTVAPDIASASLEWFTR